MQTSEPKENKRVVRIAKPYHDDKIEEQVISILRSGKLVQGEFVRKFETELSKYIGCKHVIALNSVTAALHVAIAAVRLEVGRDKTEVVTTPLSFSATANAIIHAGCKPGFVDVDRGTFNIDPDLLSEKTTKNTLAIEPVDVYGLPADYGRIKNVADPLRIPIIEDAAEAI